MIQHQTTLLIIFARSISLKIQIQNSKWFIAHLVGQTWLSLHKVNMYILSGVRMNEKMTRDENEMTDKITLHHDDCLR